MVTPNHKIILLLLHNLVWVSIAMKRQHDQGNSYKGHLLGWLILSEIQSIIITAGSVAVCKQTWCWGSQEFSIYMERESKADCIQWLGGLHSQ